MAVDSGGRDRVAETEMKYGERSGNSMATKFF